MTNLSRFDKLVLLQRQYMQIYLVHTLIMLRIRAFIKRYMEIPARSFPGAGPAVISAYLKVSVAYKTSLSRANT